MHKRLKIFVCGILCAVVCNTFAATKASDAITFKWSDAEPIIGRNFAQFKKTELAKLQRDNALEVTGLYSAAEQQAAGNPVPNLGLARAAKAAALFAPSISGSRIKLSSALVSDDGFMEATKKMAPFAAISFADVSIKSAQGKALLPVKPIPVLFPINKVTRHPNSVVSRYLEQVATVLKTSSRRAMLVGFADRRGANEMNLRLATQRAESIRAELIKLDVPGDRIDLSTRSVPGPTSGDDSMNARQLSRRVEIFII